MPPRCGHDVHVYSFVLRGYYPSSVGLTLIWSTIGHQVVLLALAHIVTSQEGCTFDACHTFLRILFILLFTRKAKPRSFFVFGLW